MRACSRVCAGGHLDDVPGAVSNALVGEAEELELLNRAWAGVAKEELWDAVHPVRLLGRVPPHGSRGAPAHAVDDEVVKHPQRF